MTDLSPAAQAVPKQCKDIPDRPILEFLQRYQDEWCNWIFEDERDVHRCMPLGTPDKLVLAKMRQLMRRGLVDGCGCGCRGDFEITAKGEQVLTELETSTTENR